MSDLPRIYGTCDAGCRWEVPHKSEMNLLRNTILTINGTELKFFVGEKAEYEALSEEEKQGLFAIITDDTTKEEINAKLNSLISLFDIGTPTNGSAVYSTLAQTGLVSASCTTEEMFQKMPHESNIAFMNGAVTLTDAPFTGGYFVFWKGWSENTGYGLAFDNSGNLYRYTYNRNNEEVSGWQRVCTATDINGENGSNFSASLVGDSGFLFNVKKGRVYVVSASIISETSPFYFQTAFYAHSASSTLRGYLQGDYFCELEISASLQGKLTFYNGTISTPTTAYNVRIRMI